MMAASGLNRGIGESALTEAQALAAVRFLLDLGADGRGATTNGENALFGAAYRGWNTLLQLLRAFHQGRFGTGSTQNWRGRAKLLRDGGC